MRSFLPFAVLLAACSAFLYAGEEPALESAAWLLKFEPLNVNSIVVERASGRGRLDWYLVYSVKNEGDQPRPCDLRLTAELLDTDSPALEDPLLKEAGLGGVKKVKTRQTFTLKAVEAGIATIEVATHILTPSLPPAVEAKLIQQESAGNVMLDIEAGRIVGQQMDLDKRVIGFRGDASSLHYLTRFTERLLAEQPTTASRPKTQGPARK